MKKEDLIRSLKNQKFSEKIIKAFEDVERSKFIPKKEKSAAYEDIPLPIGYKQTISQPYTIAFMLTLLEVRDKQKILEVGSGSGYVLALLSRLCPNGKVFGIERIKELADKSKKILSSVENIKVIHGDGSKGFKEEAPFDRIILSAAAREIPQNLINQLKIDGILIAPVLGSLIVVEKAVNENRIKEYPGFVFVPLIEE